MNMLEFPLYQLVVSAISMIMIAQGVSKYLKRGTSQSFLKLAVRIIVWGGMAAVALFPDFTNVLAKFIGLEGNINAVILIGFLLVFLIIFKILSVVERIEQDITKIIRKKAIGEADIINKI